MAIRGTFCDLAVRIDEKLVELIEVKAVGITLNDRHVKQAIDYAANQGIEWVVLTNAVVWRLYHIVFSKPIDKQLVAEIDLTTCDIKKDEDLEKLHLFSKDGFQKGAPAELRDRQDATNRFLLAAVILNNESVVSAIRRELRRIVDIMVPEEDILKVLDNEVIKRDVLEGPAAEAAAARVRRIEGRSKKQETPRSPAIESDFSASASKPVEGRSPSAPIPQSPPSPTQPNP